MQNQERFFIKKQYLINTKPHLIKHREELEVRLIEIKAELKDHREFIAESGYSKDELITYLRDQGESNESQKDESLRKLTWFKKALSILQRESKPMRTGQIAERLVALDPSLNKMKAIRVLSALLGKKADEGEEIVRIGAGKGQEFYLKNDQETK